MIRPPGLHDAYEYAERTQRQATKLRASVGIIGTLLLIAAFYFLVLWTANLVDPKPLPVKQSGEVRAYKIAGAGDDTLQGVR